MAFCARWIVPAITRVFPLREKYATSAMLPLRIVESGVANTQYAAANPDSMSEDAFGKTTGTKDEELSKIEGATHIETYWVPKYVNAANGKLTTFFARTL